MRFFSNPTCRAFIQCLLFVILFSGIRLQIQAQPAGWQHKLAIKITNTTNQSTYNFQQLLLIDTKSMVDAGQLSASLKDLRFGKDAIGNTLFPYFIESGYNTSSTKIWVQIDRVPANGSTMFYMFYGNNNAVNASTLNTFQGPFNTTDSTTEKQIGSPANNSQRGIWFRPKQSMLLTGLGKQMPVASTNTVTLFDLDTEDILEQTSVGGASQQFNYTSLSNYRWLNKGSDYVVQVFIPSGNYYQANLLKTNKYLSIPRMVFCNGCDASTLPDPTSNSTSFAGFNGGYADIQFYVRNDSIIMPAYQFGPFIEIQNDTLKHAVYAKEFSDTIRLTDGTAPFNFEIQSGSLPAGFTINNSGIIKGTPNTTGSFNFTVKVTDASAAFTTKDYTLKLNKADQTISFTNLTDKLYGDTVKLHATASSGLSVIFTVAGGPVTIIKDTVVIINGTGSASITATQAGNQYYNPIVFSQGFKINPAPLEITADNKTKIYGNDNPALTVTYNGLVNGEVTVPGVTATTNAVKLSVVGDYNIASTADANTNYAITYKTGKLTVTARSVTASLLSTPAISKTYDGNDVASIAAGNYSLTGIIQGDDAVLNKPATGVYDSKHAGEAKKITVSGLQLQGTRANNYALTNSTASTNIGIIQKKGVNVIAETASKVYGAADPVLPSQITGLVGNDALMHTLERASGENAGQYAITLKSIGNGDYKIDNYTPADFVIAQKEMIIKADDKQKEQGQINPELTFTYNGFVNGENANVFTKPVQLITTATQASPFGYYDIIPAGAAAVNYYFTYINGRLTIASGTNKVQVWPVNRNTIQLRISSTRAQKATIQIFSESGHRIVSSQQTLTAGINNVVLRVASMSTAFYIVKIDAEEFKETHKMGVR